MFIYNLPQGGLWAWPLLDRDGRTARPRSTQPPQHIQMIVIPGRQTRLIVPRAARLLRTQPLQYLQLSISSGCLTRRLVPRTRIPCCTHPL